METIEKLILETVRDSLAKSVGDEINCYSSPVRDLSKAVIEKHKVSLFGIIDEAFSGFSNDPEFRSSIVLAVRTNMAKQLVQKFGGMIEQQVNELKANPTTRAKITLAIDDIIKGK